MKKLVILLFILSVLFAVSCKKKSPTVPAPDNTPLPAATVTITASPVNTATITITATQTATATATMTVTCTITPLETVSAAIPGADYPFTSAPEIDDWDSYPVAYETAEYFDSPGSISANIVYGAVTFYWTKTVSMYIKDRTVGFYLKCPPEMAGYGVRVEVNESISYDIGYVNGLGGWQHFTFVNPANGYETASVFIIMLMQGGMPAAPAGKVYLDSVDFDL